MPETPESIVAEPSASSLERDPDQQTATESLLTAFYSAFNNQDWDQVLSMVSDDLVLDLSSEERAWGREALSAHIRRTEQLQREHVFDLTIMTDRTGLRAAVEYTVLGIPLEDSVSTPGLYSGKAQSYRTNMGVFFEIDGARISRISQYSVLPASPTLGI